MDECRHRFARLAGPLLVLVLAACSATGSGAPTATGSPAGGTPTAGAPTTAVSPGPSPLSGGVPSPDAVFAAVTCPAAEVCARLDVARLSGLPLTGPVPCRSDGATCVLVFDVYYPVAPASGGGGYPVAIFAKGGPDAPETSHSTLVGLLAAQGVVVIDTSWRQGPAYGAATWGEGLQDVACAVRAARALGPKFGGSGDRVTAIGHSLGGWAAAVVALTPDAATPQPECLYSTGSAAAGAFAGVAGVYDGSVSDLALSVGKVTAPVLLVGAEKDSALSESQALAKALSDAGRPTGVLVETGVDHVTVLSAPATIRALVDLLAVP